uniref:Uncharacterized protein n=1 Tax=Anguilla anguilla TaxID=7936 RepID=A0A0E9VDT6_ANGAN
MKVCADMQFECVVYTDKKCLS